MILAHDFPGLKTQHSASSNLLEIKDIMENNTCNSRASLPILKMNRNRHRKN
jgi:hypothetical protein